MNVQQDPAVPACRNRFAVAFGSLHFNFRFNPSISIIGLLAIAFCLASCPLASAQAAQAKETGGKCPPVTQRGSVVDVLHGVSIPDPYRWLEDQDSAERALGWMPKIAAPRLCFDPFRGASRSRNGSANFKRRIPLQRRYSAMAIIFSASARRDRTCT